MTPRLFRKGAFPHATDVSPQARQPAATKSRRALHPPKINKTDIHARSRGSRGRKTWGQEGGGTSD